MSVMPAAKNEPDDIKIRKYRDTLVTGGFALIAFGVWTVIRSILSVSEELRAMQSGMKIEGFTEAETQAVKEALSNNTIFTIVLVVIVVLMVVDLAVRVYVGYSARAVGLQKKKRNGQERSGIIWLIFGVILAALGVYSLVTMLMTAGEILSQHSIVYYAIQLLAEVTSLVVTIELVVSGFRLRGLTKKHKETEEVRDAA